MGRALILYVKEVSYPILAAFGFPANILTAAILYRGKCGLTKGITRYMVAMAMSGLLVIIFHVLLQGIYGYYNPNSFLSLSAVCPSDVYLRIVTLDYSVWLTVSFTFDRFVSICCPKLRLTYCTDRTAVTVIVSMCALSCIKYIPFQFMYEPRFTKDNVNWGCWPRPAYLTSIWWIMFSWMCSISLSFLPFLLILFFNGLTVRNMVAASRVRRRLKGNDTEAENRRKSMVLLFTVSGVYILLWTTETVTFVCTRVTVSPADGNHTSPSYIANEVGVLLIYVNSCANTCIYGMTQKKFRQEVKNAISHVTRCLSHLLKLVRM
ncbi:probable G-protein coupled receptor 139 [Amblyraja radiata]|uniref:probable G-protein coupled receptor 139 n=1 Tax=Amblyraja radiata TaxID=386614 RepID=UPI0014026CDC|nr:probable G-protein coupled receptor 139 [Amblyraja radiata]